VVTEFQLEYRSKGLLGGSMNEKITVEELEKASHNVQRLAEFIGERRDWILATDAEDAARSL
jgi:hypothetical protein